MEVDNGKFNIVGTNKNSDCSKDAVNTEQMLNLTENPSGKDVENENRNKTVDENQVCEKDKNEKEEKDGQDNNMDKDTTKDKNTTAGNSTTEVSLTETSETETQSLSDLSSSPLKFHPEKEIDTISLNDDEYDDNEIRKSEENLADEEKQPQTSEDEDFDSTASDEGDRNSIIESPKNDDNITHILDSSDEENDISQDNSQDDEDDDDIDEDDDDDVDDDNVVDDEDDDVRSIDTYESDDVKDESISDNDYNDDDDLMNDVVMSCNVAKKSTTTIISNTKKPAKEKVKKKITTKKVKRYPTLDYRLKAKKKCIKWLNFRHLMEGKIETSHQTFPIPTTSKQNSSSSLHSLPIKILPESSNSLNKSEVTKPKEHKKPVSSAKSKTVVHCEKEVVNLTSPEKIENFKIVSVKSVKEETTNLPPNVDKIEKVKQEKDQQHQDLDSLPLIEQENEKPKIVESMDISTKEEDEEKPILATSTTTQGTNVIKNVNLKLELDIDIAKKSEKDDTQSTRVEEKIVAEQKKEKPVVVSDIKVNANETKETLQNDGNNKTASKRLRVSFEEVAEDLLPAKKLCAELEANFSSHNRILTEYIDKTANNSIDDIQKHLNQLVNEIQSLNDLIKAKEVEWNNLLHLRKIKEEICFRLTRKKQIMEICNTKIGETGDHVCSINNNYEIVTTPGVKINKNLPQINVTSGKISTSTPILGTTTRENLGFPNFNIISSSADIATPNPTQPTISSSAISIGNANHPFTTSTGSTTAQSILQMRANMKSSDLAKEKANTQRLHRLLVSRNILPKPSSAMSAMLGGVSTGGTPTTTLPVSLFSVSSTNSHPTNTIGINSTSQIQFPSSSNFGLNNQQQQQHDNLQTAADLNQPILNSYLSSEAAVQQKLNEMLNGDHNSNSAQHGNNNNNQTLMVGRQGVFKDVKSIIADYRQRHPEIVPRRGRRMKTSGMGGLTTSEANSILGNALKSDGKISNADLGILLAKFDGNSRPSSNDSSHSVTQTGGNMNSNVTSFGNVSFKDVLVQFAKMSGQTDRLGLPSTGKYSSTATPPYPEVTLHPVPTSQQPSEQTGSLLHGILTKYNRSNTTSTSLAPTSSAQTSSIQNYTSSFSPTLAKLLTAPERLTTTHSNPVSGSTHNATSFHGGTNLAGTSSGLNLSKVVGGHNNEITITPVQSSQALQQNLLQQQQQHIQPQQLKDAVTTAIRDLKKSEPYLNLDDEADDSADRLVIDEGNDSCAAVEEQHQRIAPHAIGQEFNENEVPLCQGCRRQEAQFVCAGCGNQWYCSRECQVAAWDEHSEVCTG